METPYNGPVEISLFDRTALRVVAYWAHEVFREPVRFGRRVDDVMHGSTRFLRLALGLAPALMLAGCGGSAEAPKSSAPPFPGVKISVAAIGEPARRSVSSRVVVSVWPQHWRRGSAALHARRRLPRV